MQAKSIAAYNGEKPYIFVSYAHRDSERVMPSIEAMVEAGYRIWFDLGIEAGTEWSNTIASHLRDCSAFIFFASGNSVESENCLDEVAYAKSHKKPALLIFLEEDVVLPEGTEMQTARFQRMFLTRQSSLGEFVKNLKGSAILNDCIEEIVKAETPTSESVEHELAVCAKCGKENPLGSAFCNGCGFSLLATEITPSFSEEKSDDKRKNISTITSKVRSFFGRAYRFITKMYAYVFFIIALGMIISSFFSEMTLLGAGISVLFVGLIFWGLSKNEKGFVFLLKRKWKVKTILWVAVCFVFIVVCASLSASIASSCQHEYKLIETTHATCTEDGEKNYRCERCSVTKTEPIEATGHTIVNGKCSVCGHVEN